jgi:hypothetical protein
MASSVPYLQFPWLHYGGSMGEDEDQETIPGVKWKKEQDHWTEWRKALKKAGRPLLTTRIIADRYFEYLKIYRKMTKPNTIAYIEVKSLPDDRFPHTRGDLRVSVFVNDSLWIAMGNIGDNSQKVYVRPLEGDNTGEELLLKPRSLTVLRYYDMVSGPELIQF